VPLGKSKPCTGDSGGPMTCNNLQYGLCSYAYAYEGTNKKEDCAYQKTQVVYKFVNYHEKRLKNIMEQKKETKFWKFA